MTRPARRAGSLGLLSLWALAGLLGAPGPSRTHRKKDKPPASARPHHSTSKPRRAPPTISQKPASPPRRRPLQSSRRELPARLREPRCALSSLLLGRLARAHGQGLLARDLMRRYLQIPIAKPIPADRPRLSCCSTSLPAGHPACRGPDHRPAECLGAGRQPPRRLAPPQSVAALGRRPHRVAFEGSEAQLSTSVLLTPGFDSEVRFNSSARSVLSSAPPPLLTLMSGSAESGLAEKSVLGAARCSGQEGLFCSRRARRCRGTRSWRPACPPCPASLISAVATMRSASCWCASSLGEHRAPADHHPGRVHRMWWPVAA